MPSLTKFLLFFSAALAMSVAAQTNTTSNPDGKTGYEGSDPGEVPQPEPVATTQASPRYRGEVKIVSQLP